MRTGYERNQESLNRLFNSRIESNKEDSWDRVNEAYQEMYQEGYNAYFNGISQDNCPYDTSAEMFSTDAWMSGWKAAEESSSIKSSHRLIKSEYHEKDSIADIYTTLTGYNVEKVDIGWWIPELDKHFYSIADMRKWMKENKKSVQSSHRLIKSGHGIPHTEINFEYQLRENFQHIIERAYLDSNGKLNKILIENAFTEAMEDILEGDPDFFNFYNDEE